MASLSSVATPSEPSRLTSSLYGVRMLLATFDIFKPMMNISTVLRLISKPSSDVPLTVLSYATFDIFKPMMNISTVLRLISKPSSDVPFTVLSSLHLSFFEHHSSSGTN
nr:hypothetical protein CFP56_64601 [Quercus suber]